ncbi:hypothetical protein GCM10020366_06910 [Saccharopolyspora gregorii]|uniref:histidine kinase n=1 Tax=Saccharopolyspora gregorii TaxID=33914 RepID=A0ABP6RL54_9PSEU
MGVPVRLTELGESTAVSPAVGRTAYRVVQEALTNVHKHAPGSEVLVHVEYDADRVRLAVRNTRPDPAGGGEHRGQRFRGRVAGLRQRWSWSAGPSGPVEPGTGGSRSVPYSPGTCPRPKPDRARPAVNGVSVVSETVRVVVVDDEPMVCAHLRTILGSAPTSRSWARRRTGPRRWRPWCGTGRTWC